MPHTFATITVQDTLDEISRLPADVLGRVRNGNRGIIALKTDGCKYALPVCIDGERIADPPIGANTLH